MDIEVTRLSGDGLTRQVWRFTLFDSYASKLTLRLDRWERQARPSLRHRTWNRSGEGYKSRAHNGAIHYGGYRMPAAHVPMPADVLEEARGVVMAKLTVVGPVDPADPSR